jgi:hypothetical protein
MIRVGRLKRFESSPQYDNFTPIKVSSGNSSFSSLSPFYLKNEKNQIMENLWQFSKVYEDVPKSKQVKSRWNSTIIWDHPMEHHVNIMKDKYIIKSKYFKWRKKGFNAKYAIRYPIGYKNRHKCLFSLTKDVLNDKYVTLDYIESRIQIYYPLYKSMVVKEVKFLELKERLANGENLLLLEPDGPHQESLDYYKEQYQVNDNFIENNTMLVTEENIKIMLHDPKHPFGHGYCLAMALMDYDMNK